MILALKDREEYGPSLLPLLRTDQSEIGEVVERVVAQEEVVRQQRRLEREEEQKKKKAMKQAMFQKNKAIQASRRAAKKLVKKYKVERHDVKAEEENTTGTTTSVASMWSPPKKQTPMPTIATGLTRPNRFVTTGKAENVMVRLQNGKIGRALRFPDGRVVPIMRMDDAKAITGINTVPASAPGEPRKVQTFHPHISLSAHRSSIIKQSQRLNKSEATVPATSAIQPNTVTCPITSAPTNPQVVTSVSQVVRPGASQPSVVAASTNAPSPMLIQQPTKHTFPIFRANMAPATVSVSQRLTLPSGQVISLVVKQNPIQNLEDKTQNRSLGRMFVDNITNTLESSTKFTVPVPSSNSKLSTSAPPSDVNISASAHPANPNLPISAPVSNSSANTQCSSNVAPSNPGLLSTTVKPHAKIISQSSGNVANFAAPTSNAKLFSKPLGIVSPMQVKQPCASDANLRNQHVEKTNSSSAYIPVSQQQTAYIPTAYSAPRYLDNTGGGHAQESASMPVSSPQPLQLGMQNVALVSQPIYQQPAAQQVQLVPALVAGSVPLVQPVQFVQTVPLQVNAPVMFVTPGQPHIQIGGSGNDASHLAYPNSSPTKQPLPPAAATSQSM